MYEKLSKIYYKENSIYYKNEYEKRFEGYGRTKIPLRIKPMKSNEEFQYFYINHNKLSLLYEKILKDSISIKYKKNSLPNAAIHQCVIIKLKEELVSTNEIEGVKSSRKHMTEVLESQQKKSNKKMKFDRLVNSYSQLMGHEKFEKIKDTFEIRQIYDDFKNILHKNYLATGITVEIAPLLRATT
jgi:hypothetical protein